MLKSKNPRPRCPYCGWPFFTNAVKMNDQETPRAMCTRCHALVEMPGMKEGSDSVIDHVIQQILRLVSAFLR